MSYNINSVTATLKNASMTAGDIIEILEEKSDYLPEINFLEDLRPKAMKALRAGNPEATIELTKLTWSGEGSGSTFRFLLDNICPNIAGEIEAVIIWEDGAGTGLLVKDGKYVQTTVIMQPVKPEGW